MQTNENYRELTTCLCCGGSNLEAYLDLGEQPPCNALRLPDQPEPPTFPLETFVCRTCWHSQISVAVDPKILFGNYTYRTGVSWTLRDHYAKLADESLKLWEIVNRHSRKPSKPTVLDIGCNDGTLLLSFARLGCRTIGVDPCGVPERVSMDQFIESPWNPEAQAKVGKVDIITGTNVLAHNDYPRQFLELCQQSLKDSGLGVIEFPYSRDMLKHCEFDTIYHEHLSYFNVHSFAYLLAGTGLYMADVQLTEVHGGSIRFYLRHCQQFNEGLEHCRVARDLIQKENELGLRSLESYADFSRRVDAKLEKLWAVCQDEMGTGSKVIGFGASGKSAVMLNATEGLGMEYIVDETKAKQGKLNPGTNIPIFPLERLADERGKIAIVIMAWNCRAECLNKISSMVHLKDATIIDYVPEVCITDLYPEK